jgi:hypothetical protein
VNYVCYNEIKLLKGVIIMFGLVKAAGSIVISIGVGTIVNNVVRATTPATISKFSKVCIAVGALAVSNMVGDMAIERIEKGVDGIINGVKKKMNESEEEV